MTDKDWDQVADVQSNWFKFENVGDRIKGTLLGKELKKGTDYPDQWVYQLRDEDGIVWNVGVSVNKVGTIGRLNNCKVGQIIGIWFEKEIESKRAGFAPAKCLTVKDFGMDENFDEMNEGDTVPSGTVDSEDPELPQM